MKANNIFAGTATIAALLIATSVQAQQTSFATADAHATVVTPIKIEWNSDLNFGNLAVGGVGGTISIAVTSSGYSRTPSGDVSLPNSGGIGNSAAQFKVTGQPTYTYTIAISPTSITLSDGAGHNMNADNFVSYPLATGLLDATGKQDVKVGGILHVNGSQNTGVYTSTTPLTVTVSYN